MLIAPIGVGTKFWPVKLDRAKVIPETLSIQATLIWPAASSTIVGYVELLTALDIALGGALGGGVKVCACAEVTYRPKASVKTDATRQNRPKQLKTLNIIPFRQAGLPQTWVFSKIVHRTA
jgi:hypothetical protein